jgi:8-oxo-dGTP pyrophosphatase MutT (NUDIX family)
VIPRPAWAKRADPPAGGRELADPVLERLTLQAVRDTFAAGSGGPAVELLASGPLQPAGLLGAAVLIVLAPAEPEGVGATGTELQVADSPESSVLLIRRGVHLRANPGEIAFPGGRIDPGESAVAAALREAEEEVALAPSAVEVLGELPTVLAARRDVPIRPFVAVAGTAPVLKANPDEVDCVLLVPLRDLVAPGRYWEEHWARADDPTRVMHFFDLGEDVIWGATARMLYDLLLRLLSRGSGGRTGAQPGERTPRASR